MAPSAIVLDVMMPNVDGWEVLQRLHMHPRTAGIPVVICSCLLYTSDAADERSSVDLGGRRIIKKKTTEE